ncbi:uncharacterized protein EAE97_011616 [Botrytis byssoidea]|uniref:Cupin type-2 domain-containing protein n=1 Tax=Botrytis byssoidea TaxID=139641 RepID=A0A9P5HQD9_9HELO|nr:uncharacterized protein EAE97_011616 [Botrytis byssoidea]KAF7919698.1 hypothetical protein EAE97_011616 [Botrytis byssoidea]
MVNTVEPSPLTNISRHITDHDRNGKAIISSFLSSESTWTATKGAKFFLGYCTSDFPVEMSSNKDISSYTTYLSAPPGLMVPGGTVLRVVDMEPGHISPMHRTTSLDYGVAIEGEVELVLDGGEKRILKRGDICVQRATAHAWRNCSETEWARMLYVLTEAKPVIGEDGKELKEDLGTMDGVRKSG